jgi:septum site-determining protein MinD
LLLTRYDPIRARHGEIMTVENVQEILSIPLLGIIPESGEVLRSSNVGAPVTLGSPGSAPAQAYLEAARRLKGEDAESVVSGDKPRLLHRLFARRAA